MSAALVDFHASGVFFLRLPRFVAGIAAQLVSALGCTPCITIIL